MKKILSLCVALLAATQMFASFVPKMANAPFRSLTSKQQMA